MKRDRLIRTLQTVGRLRAGVSEERAACLQGGRKRDGAELLKKFTFVRRVFRARCDSVSLSVRTIRHRSRVQLRRPPGLAAASRRGPARERSAVPGRLGARLCRPSRSTALDRK